MTIFIWINKSNTVNTYYRIIFSIIIGLLFSFSSQTGFAQSSEVQRATNGDSFVDFLNKHGAEKALDEAENMVDSGKWTDKDYDNFVKFKKWIKTAIIERNAQEIARGEEVVKRNAQEIEKGNQTVAIEWDRLLNNFIALRSQQWKPWFDKDIYNGIKKTLLRILSRGEPKDLIEKIRPYERELTAPR